MVSGPAMAGEVLRARDAREHLGQTVTIEDLVQQAKCSPRACLLSFDSAWSGLVVSIPAASLSGIEDPERLYEKSRVRLRGVVAERRGRLRIELAGSSRIQVLDEALGVGSGSRIVSVQEYERNSAARPGGETRVQVEGSTDSGAQAASLGRAIEELEQASQIAAPAGDRVVGAMVAELRDRVAEQAQTIEALESRLEELHGRLEDTPEHAEPGQTSGEPAVEVPAIAPWVVPARRGLSNPRPRTGWSTGRLVREVGSPREVQDLQRDRSLWLYEGGAQVTVNRGRVESASGF